MLTAEVHWGNRDGSGAESSGRSLDNFYRTYDPTVGRYLETDPIGQAGGLNLFAYVENNPITKSDPSGLQGVPIGVALPSVAAVAAIPALPVPIPVPGIPAPPPLVLIGVAGGVGYGVGTLIEPYVSPYLLPLLERFARRDRWFCTASCNVQGIGGVCPPVDRVTGSAYGPTEGAACRAAKRAATQSAPPGTYARHCQCRCSQL